MTDVGDDVARLREYVGRAEHAGISRLPAEPQLSTELNMSRGRLRTVLKRLERDGTIWRHVGKGTFVGAKDVQPDAVTDGISVGDIMAARIMLEPQLAAQAAVHATPGHIVELERIVVAMHAAGEYIAWKPLDGRLHRTVAMATGNALLLLLYDTLRAQVRLGLNTRTEQMFGSFAGPRSVDDQHSAIVEAIRTHDPAGAQEAMLGHLLGVRNTLFGMR